MFRLKDKKIWIMIFVYGLLSILFHLFFMKVGGGDDGYFTTCLDNKTLSEFLVKRWNSWSSRLVIETVVVLILKQSLWLWKILDILCSVLVAYLLFGILFHKKEAGKAALFCGLLFILYDFREMDSAGYMTTTIFYWWVLAAAMIAFLPVYFHYNEEPVKPWMYALAIPCGIFAANQEQVAIIFVCTAVYMLGVYLWEKRKIPGYLYVLLVIGLISLAVVFLCPGNEVRKNSNIDFWFPEFANFNIIQKGLLGWYGLLRTLFEDMNWLFVGFSAILFVTAFKVCKKWYEKLIAAFPFLANLALGACLVISNFYDAGPVNKVVHAFDFDQPIVYYHGSLPLKLQLLVLAYTFVCFCVIYTMYCLWGRTRKFSHLLAVLLIGAASKVSMGMSPTVWASAERTSIFLLFGFIIIGTYCGKMIDKET